MPRRGSADFLAGVIEGFYGQPWSQAERLRLFDWMAQWGLNTYLYAPKDDLKHRALWRETYSSSESAVLGAAIDACRQRDLLFVYALSPGLDIHYGREVELERLRERFAQMIALGCQHFALLFDDIPDRMEAEDAKRWKSFASAQCHVANALFRWTRERLAAARFLFCPTAYCGRMAERKFGGDDYLATLGRELAPEIEVLWTGPEIISREITVPHMRELQGLLRRKPIIWDNLHANDYDGRRFYCGPYAGRPLALRGEVGGLLANPNSEFPLNYVPLRSMAEFIRCEGDWNARQSYRSAMREWHAHFETVGQPVSLDDLILFGDCYYLPHEDGPEAMKMMADARHLMAADPADWGMRAQDFRQRAERLRDVCVRMADLRERPLFHALNRRVWELREELDLLLGYVRLKLESPDMPVRSDFHLPGTFRGGLVAQLQRLLVQQPDASFTARSADEEGCAKRPSDRSTHPLP